MQDIKLVLYCSGLQPSPSLLSDQKQTSAFNWDPSLLCSNRDGQRDLMDGADDHSYTRPNQTAAKIVKQHLDFISRLDLILHGVHFLWKRKTSVCIVNV